MGSGYVLGVLLTKAYEVIYWQTACLDYSPFKNIITKWHDFQIGRTIMK
jgi:hypothetical protein